MKKETKEHIKFILFIMGAIVIVGMVLYGVHLINTQIHDGIEERSEIKTIIGILHGFERKDNILEIYIGEESIKINYLHHYTEMLSGVLGEEIILKIRINEVYGKGILGIYLVENINEQLYCINDILSTKETIEPYIPNYIEVAEKELGEELGLTNRIHS